MGMILDNSCGYQMATKPSPEILVPQGFPGFYFARFFPWATKWLPTQLFCRKTTDYSLIFRNIHIFFAVTGELYMTHVHIHGCWPRTAPCVLKFLKEVFRMRNLKRALSLALASVMLLGMMV
ncbi:MAG: hypothetical protein MR327_02900, partial [Clostridiales bacterium]|nr:hypothetical protein [Clostridiales bacterium]